MTQQEIGEAMGFNSSRAVSRLLKQDSDYDPRLFDPYRLLKGG